MKASNGPTGIVIAQTSKIIAANVWLSKVCTDDGNCNLRMHAIIYI